MKDQPLNIKIRFGAMSPKLKKQIADQKLKPILAASVTHMQKLADAVTLLKFCELITESDANKCYRKLFTRIQAVIKVKGGKK